MTEELTKTQADDLLEQIAEYNAQIKAVEVESMRSRNITRKKSRRQKNSVRINANRCDRKW